MRITASQLRANVYRILDEVLASGVPVEIVRNGHLLKIESVENQDKLRRLRPHPGFILCDPEELVEMDWTGEWKP